MKGYRYYLAVLLALSSLALGCATLSAGCGIISPSHHPTEEYTPVVAAATAGDLATVRDAVEKDPALLEYKEWDGATLLDDAVAQNHMDVAVYLLDKGTDVNAVKTDGVTPLHIAARNGNIGMMNLLIEHGAKINALDSKGWTPLDRANKWGHPEAAEFLRQHGGHEGTSAGKT
jgi:ankyrin repeat protein